MSCNSSHGLRGQARGAAALRPGAARGRDRARGASGAHRPLRPCTGYEPPRVDFELDCGRGTYVRALVEDFAARFSTVASVESLSALGSGPSRWGELPADLFCPAPSAPGWPSGHPMAEAVSAPAGHPGRGPLDPPAPARGGASLQGADLGEPPETRARSSVCWDRNGSSWRWPPLISCPDRPTIRSKNPAPSTWTACSESGGARSGQASHARSSPPSACSMASTAGTARSSSWSSSRARSLGAGAAVVTFDPHPVYRARAVRDRARPHPPARSSCAFWRELGLDLGLGAPLLARAWPRSPRPSSWRISCSAHLELRRTLDRIRFPFRARPGGGRGIPPPAGAQPRLRRAAVRPRARGGARPQQHVGARGHRRGGTWRRRSECSGTRSSWKGRWDTAAETGRDSSPRPRTWIFRCEQKLPVDGVYTAWAELGGTLHPSVVSVGVRPTLVGDAHPSVEAHLLDWEGDLRGRPLALHFISRMRSQIHFRCGLEPLRSRLSQRISGRRERTSVIDPPPAPRSAAPGQSID